MFLAIGGQDWRRYVEACFPQDYDAARSGFRRLCAKNGASWKAYRNPEMGAKGEELTTDVAWFGPKDASRVMVLV
ncbi:DUF2817 domain-containing protein, partial [Mesorhizobium sp. M7D.F.Ca.US.004.03.1.1]|uniref:DUF2817 domain-containing protein n=1 Tax=Mesorhizobium sp. M7D.F.Ca.US.004.03.1.1 TaxID=2496702 RepID=UPI000FCBA606